MQEIIIKNCHIHGETEFYKQKCGKWKCKKCNSEAVQRRRYKLKENAVKYKGGKCEICGYDKCIDALEFHHLNPEEKDFGISSSGYTLSWDKVKTELDKCIMVCSNCHREIHAEQKNNKKKIIIENGKKVRPITKYDKFYKQIVYMKDVMGKSFYTISDELKLARGTVMKYYHQSKNN